MLSPMRPRVGVRDVFDGFAMVDPFTAEPVDLVLIGIAPATATGADAADLAVLVGVYTRGAIGLLIWDPDPPTQPTFRLSRVRHRSGSSSEAMLGRYERPDRATGHAVLRHPERPWDGRDRRGRGGPDGPPTATMLTRRSGSATVGDRTRWSGSFGGAPK